MRPPIIALVAACLLSAGCAGTTPSSSFNARKSPQPYGPWSTSETAPIVASSPHRGSTADETHFLRFAYAIYSRYVTRVDGARCEHRPTCSRYAVEAVEKHGMILGSLLAIDRLLRGKRSSVLRHLPVHKVEDGRHYFHDPVENNDFFF